MRDDVVRRVERLAVIAIGNHRHAAVVLVAHDAARQVLARQLPALNVERVAVGVVRWAAKHADVIVVLDPPHLPVVRDVTPDQISPLARPRRPFAPERAGPQPLDGAVGLHQPAELGIDDEDVWIVEIGGGRRVGTEIARRVGDDARRRLRTLRTLWRRRAVRQWGRLRQHDAAGRAERLQQLSARSHVCVPSADGRGHVSTTEDSEDTDVRSFAQPI